MRSRTILIALAVLFSFAAVVHAQNKPSVSQEEIDGAIDKGADWLLEKYKDGFEAKDEGENGMCAEMVVYTLIHAGVDIENPVLQKGIDLLLNKELGMTYKVGVTAMALRKLDPKLYQERIAECALWLVENQCKNGQWDYGQPVKTNPPTTGSPNPVGKTVKSGEEDEDDNKRSDRTKEGTKVTDKPVKIRPRQLKGPKNGDNSNTQYAILGLRAAVEANCAIPRETWARTLKHFLETQKKDGGFDYHSKYGVDTGVAPYGSMTTAGAACIAMCAHYLKKDYLKAPAFKGAMQWIGQNFTVTENPGKTPGTSWFYYYLYGLERVGQFLGKDKIGDHHWYEEGARWLIDNQKGDGSWASGAETHKDMGRKEGWYESETSDTCFAILFLNRADKPLITETHDGR